MLEEQVGEKVQTVFNIEEGLNNKLRFFARQNNMDAGDVVEKALSDYLDSNMITTYIMGDDTGLVKIGRTKDLDKRYKQLSSGNPTLKILLEHEGDIENKLHKKYAQYNVATVGKEWFRLSQQQLESIFFEEHFHIVDEMDWEMFLCNQKNKQ